MGHPIGKGVWRFVHRESGKHLDVIGHTAQEAMLENTAAFVVAFGELPCWSRLDCSLVSDTTTVTVHPRGAGVAGNDIPPASKRSRRKRSNTDTERIHRLVGPERERYLSGSGRA
jgi:hypothetical protein